MVFGWSFTNAQDNVLRLVSSSIELEPFTSGYVNASGDTVIPIGKYTYCFTEKFDKIAIVSLKKHSGFYAIDRNEKVLFEVLRIDNGPDYVKDGLFRIKKNEKIGFANQNGKIIIPPQFDCAYPFENGRAKVSMNCRTVNEGEHSRWISNDWYFIDKSGKQLK